MNIVLNIEAKDYSQMAIKQWEDAGFRYIETSWDEVESLRSDQRELIKILIVRLEKFIGPEELKLFPNLTTIVSATTGHDHLDKTLFKEKNIQLISLREYPDFLKTIPSTAELTWALLLNLLRYIPQSYQSVLEGNWNREEFKGFQLKGKTLGIVGLGRIGSMMAQYAEAFDMKVIYFDTEVKNDKYNRTESLMSLMDSSDIISLHVHLTKETEYLISKEVIDKTKRPFYLINTSRGKIVEESAILEGIKSGKVKGYAADVLENELSGVKENPLIQAASQGLPILITPHIGGASFDAMWSCEEFIAKKTLHQYSFH